MPPVVGAALAALAAAASIFSGPSMAYAAPRPLVATSEAHSQAAAQSTPAPKPEITTQPTSTWAIVGRKARFAVTATGAARYRWQHYVKKEWTSVARATSASLSLKTSTSTDGKYRVRVSNSTGKVYSQTVTLTAYPLTIMVGHRGDLSKTRPEQSMPAFRAASKAGASMIEFDVRWTSDNRMILMHDKTLNRTTDCTGVVEEHTFAQIRRCDAGSYKGKKYAGTKVPTFEEVLAYAHQKKMAVNAEVKTQSLTPSQAEDYLAAIKAADMVGRAIMSSFSEDSVATFRSVDAKVTVPTCWIDFGTPSVSKISASGSTYFSSMISTFDAARVTQIHEAGIRILAGPAKTYADYRQVEALHLDGIIVNSVSKYRRWLDAQV